MNLNYLTESEMDRDSVNLQIVLGLESCKTREDVCQLLDDIRAHERHEMEKLESDRFLERLKAVCLEYDSDSLPYPDPEFVGEDIYRQEIDKLKDDEKRNKLSDEYDAELEQLQRNNIWHKKKQEVK